MSAYVVLVGAGEDGLRRPTVLGPFDDDDAAWEWLHPDGVRYRPEVRRWVEAEVDYEGDRPAIHVVSERTARDPADWCLAEDLAVVEGTAAGLVAGAAAEIPDRG